MALMKPSASSLPSTNSSTAVCIGVDAAGGYAWSQESWKLGAFDTRSYWNFEYSGALAVLRKFAVLVVVGRLPMASWAFTNSSEYCSLRNSAMASLCLEFFSTE